MQTTQEPVITTGLVKSSIPRPAKSEIFFSGELYWKNFWYSSSQKRLLSWQYLF